MKEKEARIYVFSDNKSERKKSICLDKTILLLNLSQVKSCLEAHI